MPKLQFSRLKATWTTSLCLLVARHNYGIGKRLGLLATADTRSAGTWHLVQLGNDLHHQLYDAFVKGDADLVEINPLILTPDHKVHALDAKVTLDDAAAFRHPEWEEFRATQEYDGREKLARELGLNYIGLDGTVGIIANGAGLAMSTLDVVNQVGGSAANFLDLGGGADANTMTSALEVINTDHNVKSVLVNIFGGITRCDLIANGIIEALSRVELKAPLVIRLDGTNAAEARKIIEPYISDNLIMRPTMLDAARTAVSLANGGDAK